MIYLFLFLASLPAVYADNDRFLYPGTAGTNGDYSQNPLWPLSSTQKVRWVTSLSSYNVTLYQQSLSLNAATAGAAIYAKSPTDSEVGGVDWIVQAYSFDLDVSPVFFLWAQNPTTSFTSHYFNITEVSASSSSSIAPSSASTIPSAPISTILSTLSTSITSAPPSSSAAGSATAISSPSPQNNDSATKVGLGVGLGLGIPTVLLLGISVGMRVMKARRPYATEGPHLLQDNTKFASASPPTYQMEPSTYEQPKSAPPVELPAKSDSPRELQ